MGTELLYQELLSAVSLEGPHAVLRVIATYQPAGGPGSKVFPPTYPASDNKATYQTEMRMLDGREQPAVLLDSVPSQANRAEEALLRARRSGAGDLGPSSGAALLRRFAANLIVTEPLADLYSHSLWALLERRGRLLEADPQLAKSLTSGVEALIGEGDLSAQSRRELEQVHYGVRLLRNS